MIGMTTDPDADKARSERKISLGFSKWVRPFSLILNIADSWVAPNQFLVERRVRKSVFESPAKNITVILIGHITKDGKIAGPKMLEHMVDTVINLAGDSKTDLRTLRSTKN
jgi:hypothetical protein